MTERLSDINARIDGIRQLGAVVSAMRGIAAARAQEARSQLTAVDSYVATIAGAIGKVLQVIAPPRSVMVERSTHSAVVLFCAEQGFVGAFSERVLDAVGADLPTTELFLVGARGEAAVSQRGIAIAWKCAMPSHSPSIPKLADRIVEALKARIATGEIDRLDSVFTQWRPGHPIQVERRRLLPFDTTAFPNPTELDAPLLNLAPSALLGELTADYLHAQLCEAALHAFAAENEARMEAMAAARNQIERKLSTLLVTQRLIRQEEITAEVIELAAGETASRPDRN